MSDCMIQHCQDYGLRSADWEKCNFLGVFHEASTDRKTGEPGVTESLTYFENLAYLSWYFVPSTCLKWIRKRVLNGTASSGFLYGRLAQGGIAVGDTRQNKNCAHPCCPLVAVPP